MATRMSLLLLLITFSLTAIADIYANNKKYNIGYQYYHGKGLKQDQKKACDLFEESSEEGYALGMSALAGCYQYGIGGREISLEKSIFWYKKSLDYGNENVLENLSLIYLFEHLDYEKAFFYAKKYEKKYFNTSAFFIKFHYYLREEKVQKAIELLKMSSEKGYIFAIVQLAHFYKNGVCQVPKDYEKYVTTKALYKLSIQYSINYSEIPPNKKPKFTKTIELLKNKKLFIESCQ